MAHAVVNVAEITRRLPVNWSAICAAGRELRGVVGMPFGHRQSTQGQACPKPVNRHSPRPPQDISTKQCIIVESPPAAPTVREAAKEVRFEPQATGR